MANEKRLIDVDAFKAYWNKEYRHQYANDMFKIALSNFPTVDAVEVVRCKDCFADGCCSVQIDLEMGGDGYCSKGKKED